jgi:hypothetical protein
VFLVTERMLHTLCVPVTHRLPCDPGVYCTHISLKYWFPLDIHPEDGLLGYVICWSFFKVFFFFFTVLGTEPKTWYLTGHHFTT